MPWRGGCSYRERAWRWVRARYEAQGWQVVEAPAPEEVPWSKGAAVGRAVEASTAEIVAIADADVWTTGFERAVYAVVCGLSGWSVPHGDVYRLTEAGTDALLVGDDWEPLPLERRYEGIWGGGLVVLRRDIYLNAPIDPRFLEWGNEDMAWGRTLHCLAGDGWRGKAPLLHLWHPPAPRIARDRGSKESWNLFLRYHKAKSDPAAMRSLLEEARCLSPA